MVAVERTPVVFVDVIIVAFVDIEHIRCSHTVERITAFWSFILYAKAKMVTCVFGARALFLHYGARTYASHRRVLFA